MDYEFGSEADFTQIAHNPDKGDDLLLVKFYLRPVLNVLKSEGGEVEEEVVLPDGTITSRRKRVAGAGRPIFEDVESVEIRSPGDKLSIIDRKASKRDKHRFARQYAIFKRGIAGASQQSGTPLKEWPGCTRSQAEELAHFNIHTVEQLAQVADGNLAAVGPIRSLVQKAADYLKASEGLAPLAQMRSAMQSRDAEISALKAQMQSILDANAKAEARATLSAQVETGPEVEAAPRPVVRPARKKSQAHPE